MPRSPRDAPSLKPMPLSIMLQLFVFGGSDGKHDGNDVYIFDTETHAWSLPSLEGTAPVARVGHSGTAVGSTKVYYFGGYGIRHGYSNDTFILDTALLSWSRPYINGAPPTPRVGHSAVVLGNLVYVYGGAAHEHIYRDLHVLDTNSMSWVEPPTSGLPPGPLFGHSAQTVGQCLFLFGGCREVVRHGTYASLHGRTHASSKLHVLDTATMTWSKPDIAGNTPLPRYRHATAMHGSLMFMFGGLGGGADLFTLDTGILDEGKADKDPMKRGRRRIGTREAGAESGNEVRSTLTSRYSLAPTHSVSAHLPIVLLFRPLSAPCGSAADRMARRPGLGQVHTGLRAPGGRFRHPG